MSSENIGPTTPPRAEDGRRYDLAPFLHANPAYQPRRGPTHAQHQIEYPNGTTIVAKFGNPSVYEMWAHDEHWAKYHLEDTQGPMSFSDARWYPRTMAIGEAHAFITEPHEELWRELGSCRVLRRDPVNRKLWLHRVWDGWNWGPDLGVRPTVMMVEDDTAGFYSAARLVEVGYYAVDAGWCRWEAHRSDIVYASGHAMFSDASLVQRSDFYLVGGPSIAPVLTGCVPQTVPHYPPFPPTPPQIGNEDQIMAAAQVVGIIHYQSKKASGQAGCTNYLLPDGSVFSCQSDGSAGTRPAGTDGPWEQGQESGALATFRSAGHEYTWLLAPVDKLPA